MELEPVWFQRIAEAGAWGISVAVHMVVLLFLSLFTFSGTIREQLAIISSVENIEKVEYKFDTAISEQLGNTTNMNLLSTSQQVAATVAHNPEREIREKLEENFAPALPVTESIVEPERAMLTQAVTTQGTTEQPGGVEGAVDRLTHEIASSLRERKTLVVWLFDVSPSLHKRRAAIASRVENVYSQLNAMSVDSDKALKSAVAVFGEGFKVVTDEPLDETPALVKAVQSIKSESSGKENVFGAVIATVNKYMNYRTKMHRNVMVVIVTDEAGSDVQNLDKAIALAKRYGIRCYVVGDSAPFGRRIVEEPFILEDGENVIGVMERGPESRYQEYLKLSFWGISDYGLENLSSGFGPYALTRLCAETNGLFFITDQVKGPALDTQAMRNYQPDYRSTQAIDEDIRTNRAKRLLVELAEKNKDLDIPLPQLTFAAQNDTVLRQGLDQAQRPMADFDYKVDAMLKFLEAGEKERAKITEPRWRAAFDLAMGRLLALRVRGFGYNSMLAEMKVAPKKFERQGSNQWRLVASREITSGANVKKLANRATEYLKRVVDEHPGTPWEKIAERELSQPLGWEWKENQYNPPAMNRGGGDEKEKLRIKFAEEEKKAGKKAKAGGGGMSGPVRREI